MRAFCFIVFLHTVSSLRRFQPRTLSSSGSSIYQFMKMSQTATNTVTTSTSTASAVSANIGMANNHPSLNVCQVDAYLKESISRVVAQRENVDATYSVTLENCVFYPEGGGQPRDAGTVNDIPILDIIKASVEDGQNLLTVQLPRAIEVSDGQTHVHCKVDWNRRFDFMQQHSAQHLLSAVAYRMFAADTVAWSLGADSVTVDLLVPPNTAGSSPQPQFLSAVQIEALEDAVNELICANNPVSWRVYSKDELPSLPDLRGAPKGAALDLTELRIVEIDGGVDKNPCGGTHVRSLGELQLLTVIGVEKERGATRLRFVAGRRALRYLREAVARESLMSGLLSAPPVAQAEVVGKLFRDKRELARQVKVQSDELLVLLASSISQQLNATAAAASSSPLVLLYHRQAPSDVNFLLSLADLLISRHPQLLLFLSSEEAPTGEPSGANDSTAAAAATGNKKKSKATAPSAALEGSWTLPASYAHLKGPLTGVFVLAGPKELVEAVKAEVLTAIGGRGGGRPGRLQGTATGLENVEALRAIITGAGSSAL